MLTHLHRIELTTAWHLKIFRKELDHATIRQATRDLETDVAAGVWVPPEYDLAEVHFRAEALAREHAPVLGARTLDILHVAAAVSLGTSRFVTGDRRQAVLADVAGLDVSLYRPRV